MRVGIHDEDRVPAGVEQDRIGGLGADAVDAEKLLAQFGVGVRNMRASEPPYSLRRKRTNALSFLAFCRK